MKLRAVNKKDTLKIYNWRNDSITMRYSFSNKSFSYSEHEEWFTNKLKSEDSLLFILQDNDEDVGFIRIDKYDYIGVVSFLISPDKRNRGYGKSIIRMIENAIPDKIKVLAAFVKKDNIASEKCFVSNNYVKIEVDEIMCFFKKNMVYIFSFPSYSCWNEE